MKLPQPGEGGDYAPPPAGTFVGVCYRFVDLGLQRTEYQGQIKHARKIMISWELGDELMDDGKPFTISKRYSWSMHEKSTLRHDLEGWRGKAFEPADFGDAGFDTKKLLGAPCTLTVTHNTKPDGKTFANVSAVGKIMRGLQPRPLTNEVVYLSLEKGEFDAAVFDKLSDGLKKAIQQSPEYAELTGKPVPQQSNRLAEQLDDDIPF
jgi:hypothetical protein